MRGGERGRWRGVSRWLGAGSSGRSFACKLGESAWGPIGANLRKPREKPRY